MFGAAAEGDNAHARFFLRGGDDAFDVGVAFRKEHEVRRIFNDAAAHAEQIGKTFSVSVNQALFVVGSDLRRF